MVTGTCLSAVTSSAFCVLWYTLLLLMNVLSYLASFTKRSFRRSSIACQLIQLVWEESASLITRRGLKALVVNSCSNSFKNRAEIYLSFLFNDLIGKTNIVQKTNMTYKTMNMYMKNTKTRQKYVFIVDKLTWLSLETKN